jgi:hypothetical protein
VTMAVRRILFLASGPIDQGRIRYDREFKEIEVSLKRSALRDEFELVPKLAATSNDFRREMAEVRPAILHFSGHGSHEGRLIFEDDAGNSYEPERSPISNLIKIFENSIECVVLNACFSEAQAEEISRHVPYVVGTRNAIADDAAIQFATAFYEGLGAGCSHEEAYFLGRNAIEMSFTKEDLDSVLFVLKKARITAPRSGETVEPDKLCVSGTISRDFSEKLYLFTGGTGDRYWPSAKISNRDSRTGTWEGEVNVGHHRPTATISLIEADVYLEEYISYYRENAGKLGHHGMVIRNFPRKLSEVRVNVTLEPLRERLIGKYRLLGIQDGHPNEETVSVATEGDWGIFMRCEKGESRVWESSILMNDENPNIGKGAFRYMNGSGHGHHRIEYNEREKTIIVTGYNIGVSNPQTNKWSYTLKRML